MSSKLEALKKLRENINLRVNGIDNIPTDEPVLVVANHNCLMDIFYLPASLNVDIVSVISPRLIYKKNEDRQEKITTYLNAMPIEAHGGKKYADMCLEQASKLLCEGLNIGIFPEGAYIDDLATVYRGRTGASRILYSCKDKNVTPYLIPVAIDIKSENLDLDNYYPNDDEVTVSILKPINYEDDYYNYINNDSLSLKNQFLHLPIDRSLKSIASTLNRQYSESYIELYKKNNVIFCDGKVVPTEDAQSEYYYEKYTNELEDRAKIFIKNKIS